MPQLILDLTREQLMQMAQILDPHVTNNDHPLIEPLGRMLRLIAEPNPPPLAGPLQRVFDKLSGMHEKLSTKLERIREMKFGDVPQHVRQQDYDFERGELHGLARATLAVANERDVPTKEK